MWQLWANAYVYLWHTRLVRIYHRKMHRFPNAAYPKLVEEKYLWRKIFDRNALFTEICDKLLAKGYAKRKCPELRIPEVLWVGTDADDIPEELLARKAVLKANHNSGPHIFLDGSKMDRAEIKKKTEKWLSAPYGQKNGEWAYRDVDRKIFIEELIDGADGQPLEEFNVNVVDGRVLSTQMLRNWQSSEKKTSRYDRDGQNFEAEYSLSNAVTVFADPPKAYPKVVAIAERLGAGFDNIRCDFYLVEEEIYFCEMTLYPLAGFPMDRGRRVSDLWQKRWDIRASWFLTTSQSGWRAYYAKKLKERLNQEGMPSAGSRL